MPICDHKFHPLIGKAGISQQLRELESLAPENIKIDNRNKADILSFTARLSQQTIHYDQNLVAKDWSPFFEGSPPIITARIGTIDPDAVQTEYAKIGTLVHQHPTIDHLQWVIDFLYHEIIKPWLEWNRALSITETSLALLIEKLIRGELSNRLRIFIALVNGASKHFGLKKPNFDQFLKDESWDLDFTGLYAVDDSFVHAPGGVIGRILSLKDKFDGVFVQFNEAIKLTQAHAASDPFLNTEIFSQSPAFEKQHPSHLGLFFTFLNLHQQFQDGLNHLSQRHLDFFYQQVLGLKLKAPTPDQAHIIFQLQKHEEQYLLAQGTKLKDGKDLNKTDILFGLDHDIVVNKTQVVDLKTLFLNFVDLFADCEPQIDDPLENLTEGLYIAPQAKSLDGLGEPFTEEGLGSWPSLGAKQSKQFLPDTRIPMDHPFARVGFVLASPILLLNEGKRTITVNLEFDPLPDSNIGALDFSKLDEVLQREYTFITRQTLDNASSEGLSPDGVAAIEQLLLENTPHLLGTDPNFTGQLTALQGLNAIPNLTANDKEIIKEHWEKRMAFRVQLSGEKEWITPSAVTIDLSAPPVDADYTLEFTITLESDLEAVTFFNQENLEEKLDTDLPVLKIELDQDVKVVCERAACDPDCCLGRCRPDSLVELSIYEFLRDLKITGSGIAVEVCGVKNVIVQNDESLQDVNALIYPFGTRPKIDANFYIGSPEILSKNWGEIHVNHNWKDKPGDLEDYYTAYQHMFINPADLTDKTVEGVIKDNNFKVEKAILKDGDWHTSAFGGCDETGVNDNDLLFSEINAADAICPESPTKFEHSYKIDRGDFGLPATENKPPCFGMTDLNVDTRDCFMRITLKCQDFQHDRYAFILSRQMMAFGRLPDELVAGAYYRENPGNAILVINDVGTVAADLQTDIDDLVTGAVDTKNKTEDTVTEAETAGGDTGLGEPVADAANLADNAAQATVDDANDVSNTFDQLKANIPFFPFLSPINRNKLEAVIPNEPYTPTIKEISLDYTATAEPEDIDLIHLYPYKDTFKVKDIEFGPTLLPVHRQQGSLFVGLEQVKPGSNLNLLLQLAETTADTEVDQAKVEWHYLTNNQWVALRPGFEIIDDDTAGLTRSGIVKISLPLDISLEKHTIMPDHLAWIRASVPSEVEAVAEAIGLHTQAVKATFIMDPANDTTRLSQPLTSGSIAKLNQADARIKQVAQLYDSFNGKPTSENFYRSASEHLRHKGRAIAAFDYERIVLEAFPKVHLAKCIQHSLGLSQHRYQFDLEVAPGFVLLALIADPTHLAIEDRFAPKLPASELTRIKEFVKQKISPFVRLKVENPRYELVKIKLQVQLIQGKDKTYHQHLLKEEIRHFLSPWVEGDLSQLVFGRPVSKSSLVKFIETRNYVDYICSLDMIHQESVDEGCLPVDLGCENPVAAPDIERVFPKTARSILVAGEINICPSLDRPCEDYHDPCQYQCDQTIIFHDCEKLNQDGCFQ